MHKCCAPQSQRYTNIATIKRALHRCWQWPRRILLIIGLAIFITTIYLQNLSHTQQGKQTVSDSIQVIIEENHAKIKQEQAKTDTLSFKINQINEQHQSEQIAVLQHQSNIDAAKKKIDRQMRAYGIQQMFDTVSCRRNITIPFLRIVDELIQDTKEPELKEYIQERYRKPWIKRMNELPFD